MLATAETMPSFQHCQRLRLRPDRALFRDRHLGGFLRGAEKCAHRRTFSAAAARCPWFLAGVSSWVSGFSAFMFVAAAGLHLHARPRRCAGHLHGGLLGLPIGGVFLFRAEVAPGAHRGAVGVPDAAVFAVHDLLLFGYARSSPADRWGRRRGLYILCASLSRRRSALRTSRSFSVLGAERCLGFQVSDRWSWAR